MAMIFDPREKMLYFMKHWLKNLQVEVLRCVKEEVQQFFHFKDSGDLKKMETPKSSTKGLNILLHELSDDKNEDMSDDANSLQNCHPNLTENPNQPWLWYFDEYINAKEAFNACQFHPAWGSLAHDYLSIMASSVSNEHAFLQGGLTITKQRNQLKGDIVEALQCLKCAIQHDLLFREPGPSSIYEAELKKLENDENDGGPGTEEGWDELLSDDKEEDNLDMSIDLDSD
ncbi:hypothetical protein C0995_004883 [Termitomyces sp. Mi166|nr:hypothetical protein C0995_004883 [Termitomyces sp. Mi166\